MEDKKLVDAGQGRKGSPGRNWKSAYYLLREHLNSYRKTVIHHNNDLAIAGHPRYIKVYSRIARAYYWPNMDKDIWKHVQKCDACQRTKPSTHPPAGQLHPLPIPGRSCESVGMDYLGPIPKSASGKDMIPVAIDRLTKMARFIPTHSSVSRPVLARSIPASWTIVQYRIGS